MCHGNESLCAKSPPSDILTLSWGDHRYRMAKKEECAPQDLKIKPVALSFLRPGSYVAFLPSRIQFNELSAAEIRRLNRLPHFYRAFDWSCRIIRQKCDTDSNVEFLPCRIQFIHYVNVLSMRRLRLAIQDGVTEGRVRFRRKLLLFA